MLKLLRCIRNVFFFFKVRGIALKQGNILDTVSGLLFFGLYRTENRLTEYYQLILHSGYREPDQT